MKLPLILGATALATAWPLLAQTPVYNLPGETGGPFTYLTISQGTEYADSAHLAGDARLLDEAVVTIYSNVARQASVTLSFYSAVVDETEYEVPLGQPGVTPGDLAGFRPGGRGLWSSPIRRTAPGLSGPMHLTRRHGRWASSATCPARRGRSAQSC